MSYLKRSGNKWTINELLSLQREYELLEWNIQKIAVKHSRSIESILYKLQEEGFIISWNDARGFNLSQYKKHVNNIELVESDDDEEYELEEERDDEVDDEEELEEEDEEELEEEHEVNELNKLTERVWNLETSLSDISSMVKQMFDNLVLKKTTTRAPLRSNKN
jgi:hypothetical protein